MQDLEYINESISSFKELDELTPCFRVLITDTNGGALFVTKLFQEFRGINEFVRGSIYTQQENTGKYHAEDTLKEWKQVVETRTPLHAINANLLNKITQFYMTSKYPIINPETNNVIGIFNISHEVLYRSIQHQLMRALEVYEVAKNVNIEAYQLTKREKQLIFLFLSGMSSKEISIVLSKIEGREISKNTIDIIFSNQIRVKFNAFSREALTEKLLKLGFDHLIPSDLINSFKIPLLDIITY